MSSPSTTQAPFESRYPAPYQGAVMTGSFNIEGREYPTYGYRMDSIGGAWPQIGGVYSVSGTYDGNDGRNLVGKTENKLGFQGRWTRHRAQLRHDIHHNRYLQRSYSSHDESEFIYWILEPNLVGDDLSKREAFWYRYLRSDQSMNGWNLAIPGETGTAKQSTETRELIRQKLIGQKRSPEMRRKMSLAQQGKVFSEEDCQKMSTASKRSIPITLRSPSGEERTFHALRAAARALGVGEHRMVHFASKSKPGDDIFGWTMLSEYTGKKIDQPRKRFHETIRDQDGKDWEVYDTRAFARLHELPVRRFTEFLSRAPVGESFCGLTKISPYKGVSYS